MSTRTLHGIGVSSGNAIGPAHVIREAQLEADVATTPEEARRALDEAVIGAQSELDALAARLRADGYEDEAGIMVAQALMAQDPSFLDMVRGDIAAGRPALTAVREAAAHFRSMFEGLDDPYLAARAADVQDVADRISRGLAHEELRPILHPSIVVAHDLTPSQTVTLDRNLVLGLATDVGSATSHTAILAGALNIPAVVGLGTVSREVRDGQEVALDGETGVVLIEPDVTETEAYSQRASRQKEERDRLRATRHEAAETRDGRRLIIAANIASPDEAPAALDAGAEGVGLFRTEFLFAGRDREPSEKEQIEAYSTVLAAMAPHTVVIRTCDIGGDKPLQYVPQPRETNPFLGERGIRYALAHRDLFRRQLRALLQSSRSGKLAIMFPMLSDVEQVNDAQELLAEAFSEVGGEAEVGIMIEIPAAALISDQLARHVSFFSVGTNDLAQYALAVDRTNERVASLYRPLHPAILRLLRSTIDGAHARGRWAGVCGELAGDTTAIPILVGLGFDELSMTPSRIPAVKARVRGMDYAGCRELAEQALDCETASEVEKLVRASLST